MLFFQATLCLKRNILGWNFKRGYDKDFLLLMSVFITRLIASVYGACYNYRTTGISYRSLSVPKDLLHFSIFFKQYIFWFRYYSMRFHKQILDSKGISEKKSASKSKN